MLFYDDVSLVYKVTCIIRRCLHWLTLLPCNLEIWVICFCTESVIHVIRQTWNRIQNHRINKICWQNLHCLKPSCLIRGTPNVLLPHSSSSSSTKACPLTQLETLEEPLIPSIIGRPILMRESEFFDDSAFFSSMLQNKLANDACYLPWLRTLPRTMPFTGNPGY